MFQFKQFTIRQDRTPMKVGTDGVLLGAWADVEKAQTILDIGTGTGLIALMSAQRNSTARIDALEIEPNAYQQAQENIRSSPWGDRIMAYSTALQAFVSDTKYDSIVCNPPFFISSTKNPDKGRVLARHCDSLPQEELLANVVRLLQIQGNFCVILPTLEAQQFIDLASSYQLFPAFITHVLPNPDKQPKRYLIKFVFNPPPQLLEDELIVELSRHHYSPKYIELTQAFYLNLK